MINAKSANLLLILTALTWPLWMPAAAAQENAGEETTEPLQPNTNTAAEDGIEDPQLEKNSTTYDLIEDDSGDDWVEPPSQRETDSEELVRLFELYREALTNRDYLEADTLAKRVVELSIKVNGLESHDSAKAITNLGIAQHNNKDYESAMLNFAASIDIIERIDDRLSNALINPLQGLAATQAATGRPDLARDTFQRAVHISHVNDGPHNASQVDTLESMAELHISMGDYSDAIAIQENIYSIQARNIDPDSMEIVPVLTDKANWLHRLQQYQGERAAWRQVINVIERHHGKDSLLLISPLTNLGKSYLFVSPAEYDYQPEVSATSGETYLRRANRIADQNPDSNWEIIEDTLLSLGDYYVLSGRPNRASNIYEEAWDLLSEGEDQARLNNRREHLETVKVLQYVFPPKYYNSERDDTGQPPPDSFETGTVSFSYTVSPSGRVLGLRHLETQPREIEDFHDTVGRSLRRLIYRPRLEDRKMVETADVVYIHEFYYRPSDLPDVQPLPESTEDQASETGQEQPPE